MKEQKDQSEIIIIKKGITKLPLDKEELSASMIENPVQEGVRKLRKEVVVDVIGARVKRFGRKNLLNKKLKRTKETEQIKQMQYQCK